jgi:hypothetical protein
MLDPENILRGRALLAEGMGQDAAAPEKAVFHYVWGKMLHLFPPISDHIAADVDIALDKIVSDLLSK